MALEDILSAIAAEADESVARVESRTDEELEELRRSTDERIAEARRQLELRLSRRCDERAERIRREATQQRERRLRQERDRALTQLEEELRQRLASLRDDADYDAILGRWLAEALELLPDAEIVRVDPRDRDRIERHASKHELRVEPTLSSWGGVEIEAEGGRRVFNTVESRLAGAADELRRTAARANPAIGGTIR
jgi:vacuolar-type H+-ATPase subunit E/Vma4